MSRHGYSDDYDGNVELYRRAVDNAIKGKRGQKLLRELKYALLALPVKELIGYRLCEAGKVCALGAVELRRHRIAGLSLEEAFAKIEQDWPPEQFDEQMPSGLPAHFNIAEALAREIQYINDDAPSDPAKRYETVLKWVEEQLVS